MSELADLAVTYLRLLESGDIDGAEQILGSEIRIVYPGREIYRDVRVCVVDRSGRYQVEKDITGTHTIREGGSMYVYVFGDLNGRYADGSPIEQVRFIDRFTFDGRRIVTHEIWNDLAAQ